jgi:hypothetical protein
MHGLVRDVREVAIVEEAIDYLTMALRSDDRSDHPDPRP